MFCFIIGFPSVGKSTLLSNLAGVYSEVAAYEFTTLTTVPGVIRYKGAKIQVMDCIIVIYLCAMMPDSISNSLKLEKNKSGFELSQF